MTYLKHFILVGFLCLFPLGVQARPALTQDQITRLESGEVIDFSEDTPKTPIRAAKMLGVFQDVPEAVLFVFSQVDKYKHFLPRVKESRITKYRGNHTYAVVETTLPWPFKDCWAYIKLTRTDKPGRVFEVKWWMINGTMENYTGSAIIEPWNDTGTKSLLTYEFLAIPKISAPDSTITKGLQKVAKTIIHKLRMRLTALRKFKKMPKGF